jgi:LSD1 subclass zinc finger protein
MATESVPVPRLDFGGWYVAFPERGSYEFLASDDLRATRAEPPGEDESGVWIGRAESGICVLMPVRLEVRRSGLRPVGLAVLHHGDEVYLAGHSVKYHEVQPTVLVGTSRQVGGRCVQCRTRLTEGAEIIRCPLCHVPYCIDCWDFLIGRKCYSRGCNYSPCEVGGM